MKLTKIAVALFAVLSHQISICSQTTPSASNIDQQGINPAQKEVIREIKVLAFIKLVKLHFLEKECLDYMDHKETKNPVEQQQIENDFERSIANFHTSQSFPKVSPEGKTFKAYLQQLKDQEA